MSSPYLGEIRLVSFSFAPKGWAPCNGQLLAINLNQALFSLLGTQYGGDGRTTFALPNLQARVPIHQGQGPGLSARTIGESDGTQFASVNEANIPVHEHALMASSAAATSATPAGNVLAAPADALYGTTGTSASYGALATAGAIEASSHENRQPFIGMTYMISLTGIFPPRP